MAPLYVKGGIWTNVEDEILRAAVAKYGLNQWARVSSLLAKKTAKQCKARWVDWLNPNLVKSDWTKEEDEKLLRYAKLMPNQWRSVAPLVGRTANQCVERYQKLLEDAAGASTGSDLALRGSVETGDINLNAESKPARPDLAEMDDEEREMLSEARARLANTQGKKAKRKAREKLLAESQRVAVLQKQRELKQAGINVSNKQKKKFSTQMDYNEDIVFQRRPEEGKFDTTEESEANEKLRSNFEKTVNRAGKSTEEDLKKKDKKSKKRNAEMPGSTIERAEIPSEDSTIKRRKLVLSEPSAGADNKDETNSGQPVEGTDERIIQLTKDLDNRTQTQSVLYSRRDADQYESDEEETEEPEVGTAGVSVKQENNWSSKKPASVTSLLATLSNPSHSLDFMDLDEEEEEKSTSVTSKMNEEEVTKPIVDRSELEIQLNLKKEKEARSMALKRSQAIQKKLSIPDPSNLDSFSTSNSDIDILINQEMIALVKSDRARESKEHSTHIIQDLDESDMSHIEGLILSELKNMNLEQYQVEVAEKSGIPASFDLEQTVPFLKTLASKSNKLENKINVQLMGYLKRNATLSEERKSLTYSSLLLDVENFTYGSICTEEKEAIAERSNRLQEGISTLNIAEQEAQRKFGELNM